MAKTKMAPNKTISAAKLELQAALMSARLCNYIGKPLPALYKSFVIHRIGEIQTTRLLDHPIKFWSCLEIFLLVYYTFR